MKDYILHQEELTIEKDCETLQYRKVDPSYFLSIATRRIFLHSPALKSLLADNIFTAIFFIPENISAASPLLYTPVPDAQSERHRAYLQSA